MDSLVELINSKKFLFIAGAPRSVTTLLANLLDNHPQCLVFPFEHSTIERFYWNHDNLDYFNKDFIDDRTSGQQSILADKVKIEEYKKK